MEIKHGTMSGYSSCNCRCDLCRAAKKKNSIEKREKKLRLPYRPLEEFMPEDFFSTHKRAIEVWKEKGLSIFEADRICTKYGVHPFAVYGTYWYSDMWEKV